MTKILIYSRNKIGKSMAGPAIRYWEFAKALSQDNEVVLVAPEKPDIDSTQFQIISQDDKKFESLFNQSQILLTQFLNGSLALKARKNKMKILIDAYDPLPLESLELFKHSDKALRQEHQMSTLINLIFSFKMADSIICASEKQRDLWIGFLLGQKLITIDEYDRDNSLCRYIEVVPFGLPSHPIQKNGPGLKQKYKFNEHDKIVLWGGGIWNWFDPLTLIKAFKQLSDTRKEIKLVFMGLKNPDSSSSETSMSMSKQAIQLAKELELIDRTVFFNYGWVPYEERQNNLLDATIGVSTHFNHLETRYSFRTRILDYIWAHLPIIATEGDAFADLIDKEKLGVVVPYQDEKAIASAILSIVDDPIRMTEIKTNLNRLCPKFHWKAVIEPITRMIQDPYEQKHFGLKDRMTTINYFISQLRCKGLKKSLNLIGEKILKTK